MTSQKSLNKGSKKDFIRALADAGVIGVIALALLCFVLIVPVFSIIDTLGENCVSAFFAADMLSPTFLYVGAVILGILIALKQFNFLMNKKSVNVYLSIGLKRSTLFKNRALASFISIFTAFFIPLTIVYILNISALGLSQHLTGVYFYALVSLTISAIAGYSFTALSMAITGNLVETGLTFASLSALPFLIGSFVKDINTVYLKGFDSYSYSAPHLSLLSPWSFIIGNVVGSYDDGFVTQAVTGASLMHPCYYVDENKINEAFQIGFKFIYPLIMWAVITLAVLIIGNVLLNRRKAENTASFGCFKSSRAIITLGVSFGVGAALANRAAYRLDYLSKESIPIVLFSVLLVLLSLIAVVFVQAILTRNRKKLVGSLVFYGGVVFVLIMNIVFVGTQNFGTYNKTPEKENIKSVSVDILGHPFIHSRDLDGNFISKDEKDIKLAQNVLNILKSSEKEKVKDNRVSETISVTFNMKNGKVIKRSFKIDNVKTIEEYRKLVYNSSYFDTFLYKALCESRVFSKGSLYESVYDTIEVYFYHNLEGLFRINQDIATYKNYSENIDETELQGLKEHKTDWIFMDKSCIAKNLDGNGKLEEKFLGETIGFDDDFYKALYNDLKNLTYEDIFYPKNIMGVLTLGGEPYVFWNYYLHGPDFYADNPNYIEVEPDPKYLSFICEFPITEKMTETVGYLNKKGYKLQGGVESKVKEILITEPSIEPMGVIKKYVSAHEKEIKKRRDFKFIYDSIMGSRKYVDFRLDNEGFISDFRSAHTICDSLSNQDILMSDYIFKVYDEGGAPLKTVPKENYEKVMKSVSPICSMINNKGCYVYVVYENKMMQCYYLPENELEKLK